MKIVDKLVQDRLNYNIYEDYAVILNQTNIGGNNNKFYIIQLLQNKEGSFFVWTRWGRVGENGLFNIESFSSQNSAENEFLKKFKSKTGNKWSDLKSFVAKTDKYVVVEVEEKKVPQLTILHQWEN
jgi:poly [ADP-ribose] polymerase